ncbi:hypothetical protein XCR1_1040007 [Xenorhabdus cabanillasii JM26]|uniref:Uncharacterized protein n=1 Tax=Xenorhabdus cabanillasii JM26 TaxID=1427517 RepID=W1IKP3_9GAMM|nr:hypothetical protein XCR1_1040007 [Xenorhabdus cabanillasii JM26]
MILLLEVINIHKQTGLGGCLSSHLRLKMNLSFSKIPLQLDKMRLL